MSRKITSGIVGRAVLGSLSTDNNSIQSIITNANLLLEPNGTGIVQSTKSIQIDAQNTLRLADADSSNYIALRSPATVSSNVTLTFPNTAGSNTQMLQTDGSGTLSWAAPFVAVANQSADTATYYPAITTSTSGTASTFSVSSTKLTFVPSTGVLSATELRATASTASSSTTTGALVVTGGVGIGGTMTATSIVETSSITLKENILPIENALESILKLSGVTYDRTDNNEHEAGLIAEWTDKVLPDLVTKDALGNTIGIKYTKLTAYLIESIKTLKLEIDELKGAK
jgi:hypothetical protein